MCHVKIKVLSKGKTTAEQQQQPDQQPKAALDHAVRSIEIHIHIIALSRMPAILHILHIHTPNFSSSCLLLLFLTFSVLVANPKKLLYTVANPARGLLNREKRTKEKVWQHTPPPPTPHTARSEKINKITRRIYRRYAGGRSRVRTRIPSARRLGLWVWLRKILHSRLR